MKDGLDQLSWKDNKEFFRNFSHPVTEEFWVHVAHGDRIQIMELIIVCIQWMIPEMLHDRELNSP